MKDTEDRVVFSALYFDSYQVKHSWRDRTDRTGTQRRHTNAVRPTVVVQGRTDATGQQGLDYQGGKLFRGQRE